VTDGQNTPGVDGDTLSARVAEVRRRIAAACEQAGRDPAVVRLLPVSKTRPVSEMLAVAQASGLDTFGENRPQELAAKAEALPALRFALIGHLQTNKAALAARFAAEFQALDSPRLAAALDRHLQAAGHGLDVLIEVNTSGETTKHGLAPSEVGAFARGLAPMASLRVRGLMTVAANTADVGVVDRCFATLRDLRDRLRDDGVPGADWAELSMGMSGDYERAIINGSTTVRVGTAIFGARTSAPTGP